MHDSVFFRKFSSSVEHLPRPKKFTFPFYYTAHSLAINAAIELAAPTIFLEVRAENEQARALYAKNVFNQI